MWKVFLYFIENIMHHEIVPSQNTDIGMTFRPQALLENQTTQYVGHERRLQQSVQLHHVELVWSIERGHHCYIMYWAEASFICLGNASISRSLSIEKYLPLCGSSTTCIYGGEIEIAVYLQLGSLLGADFATLSRDPFLNPGASSQPAVEVKQQHGKPRSAILLCERPPIDWSLKKLIRVSAPAPLRCCEPIQSSSGKQCLCPTWGRWFMPL